MTCVCTVWMSVVVADQDLFASSVPTCDAISFAACGPESPAAAAARSFAATFTPRAYAFTYLRFVSLFCHLPLHHVLFLAEFGSARAPRSCFQDLARVSPFFSYLSRMSSSECVHRDFFWLCYPCAFASSFEVLASFVSLFLRIGEDVGPRSPLPT